MCATHGREIDNDEIRFSVELLREWKEQAEARAQQRIGVPTSDSQTKGTLNPASVKLVDRYEVNMAIGRALDDAGVGEVWGLPVVEALRDLLIEVAKNAFRHGNAQHIRLEISSRNLVLSDDGARFNPLELIEHTAGGGGKKSVDWILNRFAAHLVVTATHSQGWNQLSVSRLEDMSRVEELIPCVFVLKKPHVDRGEALDVPNLDECVTVHVVLPRYMTISDIDALANHLVAAWGKERKVVFVLWDSSPHARMLLRAAFPSATFVQR
jgi:hypothetical protein